MASPLKLNQSLSRLDANPCPNLSGFTFLVLEISRYYPEPSFSKRYGIDACHFWDIFDLTLSDRQHRRKVVLTADAKIKQKVHPGCAVTLLKVAHFCEETSIDRETVIIVQQLEVVQDHSENVTGLKNLPWTPIHYSRQKENVPIASFRPYYADEWTFNVDYAKLELNRATHCPLSTIDLSEVYSIRDVITKKVSQYRKPSVLVKVMRKSRLIHYVTKTKEDKWPFLLPLVIADQSGWCAAVLWNRLSVECVHDLQEGSIVLLSNFRVKTSLLHNQKSFFSPPEGTVMYKSELSLDSHHPKTELKMVDVEPDDDIDQLRFPLLETCLMTRKNLISVPDFSVVDVAGVITFVGRVEREPKKASGSQEDSGGFFYRRWIHLRDVSMEDPIILLVYSGDQKDVFLNLSPGKCLLCRHVLTNQQLSEVKSSRHKRHGWVTTTTNSWLYVVDLAHTEALPEPLEEMVKTAVPQHPQQNSRKFLQGGFFRYPPFPPTLERLKNSDSSLLEMVVPSDKWTTVFDWMTWRECHQMVVHASLISLSYIDFGKGKTPIKRRSPRKRRHSDESEWSSREQTSQSADSYCRQLGVAQPDVIKELWPSSVRGNPHNHKSAVLMKWQGLSCPTILNTIKPCALRGSADVENFSDFVCGEYDSDLGLVQHDRSELGQREIKAVTEAAQTFLGCNFVLLIDVYTNTNNQQLVTLNRAYLIT